MDILSLFIVPERTKAGYSFADSPVRISFKESSVAIYGVPLDITTSFGKGTSRGPEAIRRTSARQIETFMLDEKTNIHELVGIFDLGDLKLPKTKNVNNMLDHLELTIPKVVDSLRNDNKIPVMLGGEHTLSYYQLKALAQEDPLVIHFDAHRDLKPIYDGMEICHTTPFYHLINEGYLKGRDLVQIGIRQCDKNENYFATDNEITTFDAWYCYNSFSSLTDWIKSKSRDRNVYISFDIDVYDISYVPCTGTPEPFGLNPFQICEIINSIDDSSNLVGLDFVETGLKNNDYREGALATNTLLRILTHNFIKNL